MNEHTNPSKSKHTEHEQHMENQNVRFEEPNNKAVEHHHHYYYGEPGGIGTGTDAGVKSEARKPWYNQGWMWLIVAVVGIGALLIGMMMLSGQVGGVGEAVKEQTGAIREQTGVLNSINRSLQEMSAGLSRSLEDIKEGMAGIEKAVREGINTLLSVFK